MAKSKVKKPAAKAKVAKKSAAKKKVKTNGSGNGKAEPRHLINFKITGKDQALLTQRAKKFANGNLSAWLRYAGSHYVPPKKVVIE